MTTDEERVLRGVEQTVKIGRLNGCKNVVGKRKEFIFDAFVDLQPVKRFENGSDM